MRASPWLVVLLACSCAAPQAAAPRPWVALPFRPSDAKQEFLSRLAAGGDTLERLTVGTGVATMVGFYRDQPAAGMAGGVPDLLLFDTTTSGGSKGERFEVVAVRAFLAQTATGTETMPLELTFSFKQTPALRALSQPVVECQSLLELDTFRKTVVGGPAWAALADAKPDEVTLTFRQRVY